MAAGSPSQPDWYEILGVSRTASDAEIGRAFRAMARRFHPDTGAEASGARFSDVARAYEVLRHPGRRADYDRGRSGIGHAGIRIPVRRWRAGQAQAPAVDPTPGGEEPDEPREVDLAVTVAESVTGTTAKVPLRTAVVCGDCSGSGQRSGGACATCAGQGRHRRLSGSIAINTVCPDCAGTGARPREACPACSGQGWREQARELTVRVPPGVADGTRLRLRSPSGGAAGFARVRLQADRWFSRDGRDLILRLPLTVAEAALGTVVAAALPGGAVDIAVPAGTRPGARLRLPGRGVAGSPPGDLVVAVEVIFPVDPGEEERAALEMLKAASPDPRSGWPAALAGPKGRAKQAGPGAESADTDSQGNVRRDAHVDDAL